MLVATNPLLDACSMGEKFGQSNQGIDGGDGRGGKGSEGCRVKEG